MRVCVELLVVVPISVFGSVGSQDNIFPNIDLTDLIFTISHARYEMSYKMCVLPPNSLPYQAVFNLAESLSLGLLRLLGRLTGRSTLLNLSCYVACLFNSCEIWLMC